MPVTVERATHHILVNGARLVLAAAPRAGQPPELDETGASDQCAGCGRAQTDLSWSEELDVFACPCGATYPVCEGGYTLDPKSTWTVRTEDWTNTVKAEDLKAATTAGIEWLHAWAETPKPEDGTLFVRLCIDDADGNLAHRTTVGIDPREPGCAAECHDWQRPHKIVGGLASNPGVVANAGGVIFTEVCVHCGCARVTNTWAQDRVTGEQGLRSKKYEPGRFADQIRAVAASTVDEGR